MSSIKPIETFYKGYRFRSRLEARWSILFDAMGIKYIYEPQGFALSDGTCYLPDFYLPEMNQFFEVKGVLDSADKKKIVQFINESKKPLTIGYDDFTFSTCSNFVDDGYSLEQESDSILMKCNKCGKYYFTGVGGSWECSCCGYYDGDNTSQWISTGNLDMDIVLSEKYEKTKFRKAIERAKQARFEHGESGNYGR